MIRPPAKILNAFVGLLLIASLASCASIRRDRCYLMENRYIQMKAIFESTGSYQRVAQAMRDEGWAHCEINSFRYRLRNELELEGPEFDSLFVEHEPARSGMDYNPGRVERAP